MMVEFSWEQASELVDSYSPPIIKGLRHKVFNSDVICETKLQWCKPRHFKARDLDAEIALILADKPESLKNDDFIDNLYQEIADDKAAGIERETISFYHLADLHIDLQYTTGAKNAHCGGVVCCRGKEAKKPEDRAGKWGDYHCDLPIDTLKQLHLTQSNGGDPDFIVWTGDNVAHDPHKHASESVNATLEITNYIKKHYNDTIVFPIHGNHEFAPMNLQDLTFEDEETREAIDNISEVWQDWMTEESYEQYRNKSFYDMKASEHPKAVNTEVGKKLDNVRVLAVNTQSCYVFNFFTFYEMGGELGELEWLEATLREMEKNDEVAIVFMHIPTGGWNCGTEFSTRLQAILDRFQHIIRVNIAAHTHNEEFNVQRAVVSGKPIGVQMISGSVTTSTYHNPQFRSVTLDLKTMLPILVETERLDIEVANKNDAVAPEFEPHHSYPEAFQMEDLRPTEYDKLTSRLDDDECLSIVYYNYFVGGGPKSKPTCSERTSLSKADGCDAKCRRAISCQAKYNTHTEVMACKSKLESFDYLHILFSVFTDPWIEPVSKK